MYRYWNLFLSPYVFGSEAHSPGDQFSMYVGPESRTGGVVTHIYVIVLATVVDPGRVHPRSHRSHTPENVFRNRVF